ncbi:MAG TPA: DUF748 domain-containing protein, partial [Desulfotignum sp.]|nr:DUF748 domain-containing protein [Desulfotignum sp.]
EKAQISMNGTLGAKKTEIVAEEPQLQWHHNKMTLDCDISVKSAGPLYFTGTADLDMKEGKLLHPDEGKVAAFASLVIQQLEHDDAGNLSIAAVDTSSLAVHESGFIPLGLNAARASLAEMEVSKLRWSKKQGARIQSITGNGLQGRYTRKEENKEKTAKKNKSEKQEKPAAPIPLRIDKVTLTGSNRLEYTDPTRKEPFSAMLSIDALDIADIDPGQKEQAFSYDLEGMVDKYSPLSVSGSAAPLARPRFWEQKLHLQAYPVANLSAFTIELIGARVTGGKLELTSEFEIKGDAISMDNTLKVDEIKTKTVVPARLEKFNQKLPVSLDTALGLLQEDKTIQLSIPVEGKLSELDINYQDIMVTALSKAIGSAVRPLLAYSVLGPGGVLAYMGMQIGKNLIKTELPELTFAPGSTVLTAAHKDTLDQVGHRLAQQIKQGEDISYYIYPRVAPREVSDAGDAALLDKKQRQELYALGEKRAHRVQSYLVNNFDIQEKNVPVFQPGIIYDKKESRGTVGFMKQSTGKPM